MKKSHCFYSCQTYLRCVLFEDKAFISEGFFLNLSRSLDLIIDINNTVVGNIEVHYVPHFLLSCWKYMTHPQRFFWQITYSSIMFRYLIICIRWCLSLRSIIEDIIHRYSRRPIVNPLDWSVKFAVWGVLYAKKYEESKNPCCHFWKWGYHALFGPGGRSDCWKLPKKLDDVIFRSDNIDFWIPRTFLHKKRPKPQTLPIHRAELFLPTLSNRLNI